MDVSNQAIKREQEVNREYRKFVISEKKTKIPPEDELRNRKMIDNFYKHNKVTHVDCIEKWGQTTLKRCCSD